jgi:AAA15 family ATPase/GTPase
MIKSINIQNFKIFKKSKFSDFGQINLLGGLNNGGKTTLLEAIYLGVSPSSNAIVSLKKLRREVINSKIISATYDTIWDNLFYLHDKKNAITIDLTTDLNDFYRLNLTCDSNTEDFVKFVNSDIENDSDITELSKSLSNQEISKSVLHIDCQKNAIDYISSVLVASQKGLVGLGHGANAGSIQKIALIPSMGRIEGEDLAKIYSQAELRGLQSPVKDLLQVFDKDLEDIRVFSNTGKPVLYVRRKNEPYMLLSAFGDAMNRMVDLVLRIVNNENGIVLFDEIENGVHYTNHDAIWTLIFRLAREKNVQIFATTHSKEMMNSFDKVALENSSVEAKYIEILKSARTNNIKSNNFDTKKLEYALLQNENLRGEN